MLGLINNEYRKCNLGENTQHAEVRVESYGEDVTFLKRQTEVASSTV